MCGQAEQAFSECERYLDDFPLLSQNEVALEAFLQNHMRKIRTLGVGDVALIPAGWANPGPTARSVLDQQLEIQKVRGDSGERQTSNAATVASLSRFCSCVLLSLFQDPKLATAVKPEMLNMQLGQHVGVAHWILCVLDRPHTDHFRLAIINQTVGSGLEYHPSSATHQPYIKRKLAFVIDDIPVARLHDSSFWFMLMKMQVWPMDKDMNGAKWLYETLLPYLNNKPLYSNMIGEDKFRAEEKSLAIPAAASSSSPASAASTGENDDLVEWRVLARNGDPYHTQLSLEALSYMLRALGISRMKVKYFVNVVFKCNTNSGRARPALGSSP